MMTMEFEEMKKIWDEQNNQPLYAINEEVLYNRVLAKKKQAGHTLNFSEWLTILVNVVSGCFVFGINLFRQNDYVFLYVLAAWMLIVAAYIIVSRIRRIRGENTFDRSLYGDLNHAVAMAAYQVRFSQLMRWNILPIVLFVLFGVWESGKPVWLMVGVLVFFILTHYAARWEHSIYKTRKRELETLQKKLQQE
ncbi:MAG: hypothetical protein KF845_09615 [Cyclobacteriaceae bacterium]|nr:hypothetical protein [Cyclobacteriaceae bacterium]